MLKLLLELYIDVKKSVTII